MSTSPSTASAKSKTLAKAKAAPKRKAAAPKKAQGARSGAVVAVTPATPVTPVTPAKPPQAVKAAKASKPVKGEKAEKKAPKQQAKLVRDGFTMPEADFALIATLKARAIGAKRETKKSELLRAGLRVLAGMDAKSLLNALNQLEAVKVGRPRKAR